MASALIFSPRSTEGSTLRLISSQPTLTIGGQPMVCDNRLASTPPAPQRASSCAAMMVMNRSPSLPPQASGKPRPSRPISAALRYSSTGKLACASQASTFGVISRATKRRMASRKAACSAL